ncbi:MAG: MCP four helix bundle domain-containing protein, partial [Clostridiales bacterium]|nr:MCP four helix bundle domain-containing protein [Clostridiales bacterium]
MKNLSIKRKLLVVQVASFLAVLMVAVFSIVSINRLSTHLTTINNSNVYPLNKLVNMVHYFDTLRMYVRDATLTSDPVKTQQHLDRVGVLFGQLVDASNDYKHQMEAQGITSGHEYSTISSFIAALPEANSIVSEIAALALANEQAAALHMIESECVPYNQRLSDYLSELATINNLQSNEMAESAKASAVTADYIILGTAVVTALLGFAVISLVSKAIVNPLNRMVEATENIANGYLNVNIDTSSSDEIGMLARSISTLADAIKSIMDDMTENS